MSVNLMSAIFEVEFFDLKDEDGNTTKASTAKLVLLAMADHANDEGEGSYPSIERLCRKTALSEQTIRNTFDALRHNGIISLRGRSKYGTNNHTINTKSFPRSIGKETATLTLYPLEGLTDGEKGSNGSLNGVAPVIPESSLSMNETKKELSKSELQSITEAANKTVDGILQSHDATKAWQGRGVLPAQYLPLADWYHETTGQVCSKRVQRSWLKALSEWQAEGLTVEHLKAAHENNIKWRTVNDPNMLTSDAVAIKAAGKVTAAQPISVQYDKDGYPESW